MTRYLTWLEGRRKSGYFKMKLMSWEPYFDLYLLKMPKGSRLGWHKDEVEGRRHYRLNFIFGSFTGGNYRGLGSRFWRFIFIRPDRDTHSITEIRKGTRYVLSFGFTLAKGEG